MTVIDVLRVGCVCLAFAAPGSAANVQRVEADANVEMSVRVSIAHTVVDQDGKPALPPSQPTVFTVLRTRRSGTWQTVMTYDRPASAPARASSHPLNGARVEFDEDSGWTRVFDATGTLDSMLSKESDGMPAPYGPRQWLEGLIATDLGREARSRDLSEKYGAPVGMERGLNRFLVHRDDVVEEVLADPQSALPYEINTVRDGVLESHILLEYDRRADGAWSRRSMTAEQVVPGDPTRRTRTTLRFSQLSIGGR